MAKKSFRNLASLFDAVQKTLESSAKEIGIQGFKTVKDQVETDVYKKYNPKYYQRTGQLKSSLRYTTMKHKDGAYILFDHDKLKMDAIPPTQGKPPKGNYHMGQHHSTAKKYSPQKYNDYVAMVVHDGTSGDIFGDGEWRKPRPYMQNSRAKVARQAYQITKGRLQIRGFKVMR